MPKRFAWLDGVRGIAAIAVMLFHFEDYLHIRPLFRSSFLAVDLFFLMSGFVLAHSYGEKLGSGYMSFGRFMVVRLIRLWPMYLFATSVGCGYYSVKVLLGTTDAPAISTIVYYLGLNLIFLPVPVGVEPLSGMFPFAPSSWSLATEMLASAAFGVVLFRLRRRHLAVVGVVATLSFLAVAASYREFDLGWSLPTFSAGILRTVSEFATGLILYRVSRAAKLPPLCSPVPLLLVGVGVLVSLLILPPNVLGFPIFATFGLFPLFIMVAARTKTTSLIDRICDELGRISYPLYLLHTPILLWVAGVWKLVLHRDPTYSGLLAGVAMVIASLVVSYLSARFIDEPVRAWLTTELRKRRPVNSMATATPERLV